MKQLLLIKSGIMLLLAVFLFNSRQLLGKSMSDALKPTAFISGKFDDEFLDFFIRKAHLSWKISEERMGSEKKGVVVQSYSDDQYFVQVIATPEVENWYIMKDPPVTAMISYGINPFIVSGKLDHGKPTKFFKEIPLKDKENSVHFVWPIELHDLGKDGAPEIWIRYIKIWADGFSQELAIYKIKDDNELILFKQFSGEAEGIARRLDENKVEIGTGFSDKAVGHLGFDQTHLEIWEYQGGKFVKNSQKDVPHILRGKSWYKYYF